MSKKNVADVLVDTLAARGVERIYGVAGDSLNGITDSIRRQEHMRWAHVRHEETAAFAAGAEAHLTGRLTVCAGSCGPGNLHLINGLYDCHRSRVPVLAIAAQIPSHEIGSGYFQETHPEHLFAAVQSLLRAGVPTRTDAPRPRDCDTDRTLTAWCLGDRPARRCRAARCHRTPPASALSGAEATRVSFR